MKITPVQSVEEYVEQAHLFATLRQRLADARPAQEALDHLAGEILATTQLHLAVDFLRVELRHSGRLADAFVRLDHYFTPFQAHVIAAAETDEASRFTMTQALSILEREAKYRSVSPTPAGLFVYELESISRNRLGYSAGLDAMARDGFFDADWRTYIALVRRKLGERDFAELIYLASEHLVARRRRSDPEFEPNFPILFGEREGRIGLANRDKDPMYLFATLQRQLGYPEAPRLPRRDDREQLLGQLQARVAQLEKRLAWLEAERNEKADLSEFLFREPPATGDEPTVPPALPDLE